MSVVHRLPARHAAPAHQLVVLGPIIAVARVVEDVDAFAVLAGLEAQTEVADSRGDHIRATDQHRTR
jgi:hypothetical protein